MIKNEHQYRVTQKAIGRFESALEELSRRNDDAPARLKAAREAALRSKLESLRAEAEEFAALRNGSQAPTPPKDFHDVGRFLIQTRIARGWTQQELSENCDLKEQQIQRYEANDYEQASLGRICEIAHTLGVNDDLRSVGLDPHSVIESKPVPNWFWADNARIWLEGVIFQGRRCLEARNLMSHSQVEQLRALADRIRREDDYFVSSIAKALRFLERTREHYPQLATTIDRYEAAIPNARSVRNIREHVDEYFAGKGRDRESFWSYTDEGGFADASATVGELIGGRLNIRTAIEATESILGDLALDSLIHHELSSGASAALPDHG